jgi:hypothetical protein
VCRWSSLLIGYGEGVGEEPNHSKAERVELFKLRLELASYNYISQRIYIIILYCVACEYLQ